jgi:hypothetical protein
MVSGQPSNIKKAEEFLHFFHVLDQSHDGEWQVVSGQPSFLIPNTNKLSSTDR